MTDSKITPCGFIVITSPTSSPNQVVSTGSDDDGGRQMKGGQSRWCEGFSATGSSWLLVGKGGEEDGGVVVVKKRSCCRRRRRRRQV